VVNEAQAPLLESQASLQSADMMGALGEAVVTVAVISVALAALQFLGMAQESTWPSLQKPLDHLLAPPL